MEMEHKVEVVRVPDGKWAVIIDGELYGTSRQRYDADFAAQVICKKGKEAYERWAAEDC